MLRRLWLVNAISMVPSTCVCPVAIDADSRYCGRSRMGSATATVAERVKTPRSAGSASGWTRLLSRVLLLIDRDVLEGGRARLPDRRLAGRPGGHQHRHGTIERSVEQRLRGRV